MVGQTPCSFPKVQVGVSPCGSPLYTKIGLAICAKRRKWIFLYFSIQKCDPVWFNIIYKNICIKRCLKQRFAQKAGSACVPDVHEFGKESLSLERKMKKIITEFKKYNFLYVYEELKKMNYQYTLENIFKDFKKISSENKYCFLLYVLAKEYTTDHILLICDFLIYTDTFFYDVYPVVNMLIEQGCKNGADKIQLEQWARDNLCPN